MSGLLSAIIRHYCGAAQLRDHVIDTTVAARRRMRSARPARPRSRVATPSATPQRFQDFTKDFKISRRFQDFTKISRRFQDFTKDFKISQRFQDFKEDFKISKKISKISVEISAVVYEISASGGPLGVVGRSFGPSALMGSRYYVHLGTKFKSICINIVVHRISRLVLHQYGLAS